MAVIKIPQKVVLAIRVQKGVNTSGNPVYADRNYANVKPAAADADIMEVAQALMDLFQYSVANVQRIDYANLITE